MQLTWHSGRSRYESVSSWTEKDIPKGAGCRWDREHKTWWTDSDTVAARLAEYAIGEAADRLAAAAKQAAESLVASRAATADIDVPAPEGMTYRPFQRAVIAYAMSRNATLIGDDMGLGKTIQAIGVINADPSIRQVLVVAPEKKEVDEDEDEDEEGPLKWTSWTSPASSRHNWPAWLVTCGGGCQMGHLIPRCACSHR